MELFSKKEILKRRINYAKYVILNMPIYDFYDQAILEEERCVRERGLSIHCLKMRNLITDVKGKHKVISRICISVTNQCSLRCVDCNNLMPYCKERYFADLDDVKEDVETILNGVDKIVNVEVIGGEPFIYRDLYHLIKYLCDQEKIDWVEITTNATVLPNDEQMGILRNEKVILKCSDYGDVNREKLLGFQKIAKRQGFRCVSLKNYNWYVPGGIDKRIRTVLHQKYNYYQCSARKDCKTLYKGRLYMCGRAPVLDELGIPGIKDDSIDIRNRTGEISVWDDLTRLFQKTNANCCNYCDCSDDAVKVVKSGIQLRKMVSEC